MKTAIVHYWLVGMRGGEKVVEALCGLLPEADLFTHVYRPGAVSEIIRKRTVRTTFIDRLPNAAGNYKSYLPLMPMALEQLDLSSYDLVVSSESGPAKGVVPGQDAVHVCYCHTPMRYVWNLYDRYKRSVSPLKRLFMVPLIHYLRLWDRSSADRVDHFVANSKNVAARIRKYYRRPAEVIYPPVDTSRFEISRETGDYYLMVGQLVDYKRFDLGIEACRRMGKKLIVVGDGDERSKLGRRAGPGVKLVGWQDATALKRLYSGCRALIFPGDEDFGIVPVEAMASGRPVIAYGKGGALESVREGRTGLFFETQTVDALCDAMAAFERGGAFDAVDIARYARRFDVSVFESRMRATLSRVVSNPGAAR